jgi:hypothetical protein
VEFFAVIWLVPVAYRVKNGHAPGYGCISPQLRRVVLHDWNRFSAQMEPISLVNPGGYRSTLRIMYRA